VDDLKNITVLQIASLTRLPAVFFSLYNIFEMKKKLRSAEQICGYWKLGMVSQVVGVPVKGSMGWLCGGGVVLYVDCSRVTEHTVDKTSREPHTPSSDVRRDHGGQLSHSCLAPLFPTGAKSWKSITGDGYRLF
jgi:hypothetical protein